MITIQKILQERIGLDPDSIGTALVERAIRRRMKRLGLRSPVVYEGLLNTSDRELNELAELVVVTETWFFRDLEPFTELTRFALQEWLPVHGAGALRILSLPCSTGEEPYSAAIALLDAGVSPGRFVIEAFDLSEQALVKARRGVYGCNSFRGGDLSYRRRHFQHGKDGYAINRVVKNCVHFGSGNLLDTGFLKNQPGYDVVFCRNLLIYFDAAGRQIATEKLGALVNPSGLLFVGPAEMPIATERGFVSAELHMAFACRRGGAASTRPHPTRAFKPATPPPPPPALPAPATQPRLGAAPPTSTELKQRPQPPELDQAQKLADAGQLREAAGICEDYIAQTRGSAQAFYLLGLVREAAGDLSAMDCYRKALYLEPDHYETLVQMATLAEKAGDRAKAKVLKRRAERANTS